MKCPKCGYLGFEHVERCRNCGYDFSLAQSVTMPELPLRSDQEHERALDDLSLIDATMDQVPVRQEPAGASQDPPFGLGRRHPTASDLPLFGTPIREDDEPLITKASPPRAPLAVRRSTPEVPRLRPPQPRPQTLDLGAALDASTAPAPSRVAGDRPGHGWPEHRSAMAEDAGAGARLVAVALDAAILAVVDALVIYFTMKICGLGLSEFGVLPKGPLVAFLLVQNGGYLVAFTAGGQTLGKMAVGIKVVAAESPFSLDLGRAFVREALWLVLAAPAGLGFLTILARDHRGLHDRFAGTRVVR